MITFPGRNTSSAEVVPGRKEINICPPSRRPAGPGGNLLKARPGTPSWRWSAGVTAKARPR